MLKRQYRLPGEVVFKNAFYFSTPLFVVKAKINGLLFNRFAVVVAKSIDKRAVVRNKIKRMTRSAIEDLFLKEEQEGRDILLIAKKTAIEKTKIDIKQDLEKVLLRAK